ncbi:MAG: molybdate ABC transporter substrate-binding protein [Acidimicrobiales bacterium]
MRLQLKSAGAAQGLVESLRHEFAEVTGAALECVFGPVGMVKRIVEEGEPCDAVILSETVMSDLARHSAVLAGSVVALGWATTAVAARLGDPTPDVSTAAGFRNALLDATRIHVPDFAGSTAGKHLTWVLNRLGIAAQVEGRLCEHRSGAEAMAHLADEEGPAALGVTQAPEIFLTRGVTLGGVLPGYLGLSTLYMAGVAVSSQAPDLAGRLVGFLTSPGTVEVRRDAGFDVAG